MDPDAIVIDPALSAHSRQTLPASRPAHEAAEDDDDDDDPIVASYNIFLKPSKLVSRNLKIIETPNQIDPNQRRGTPLELRTKPNTGMFEVDYSLDYTSAYDRAKGLNWGTALQKSNEAKKGGSHGLAGGFGVGAPPPRATRGGRANDGIDYGMDWSEALRKDMVLRTQTLGGQTPDSGAESGYMVAVFAGGQFPCPTRATGLSAVLPNRSLPFPTGNLHLTSASSLIHLRPQPHHIDAVAEQEKTARGLNAAAGPPPKEAARAIHMTIKQTVDGGDDELVQETMADRLKRVQNETWRKMRYIHEEDADSWAMSEEVLYTANDTEQEQQAEGEKDGTASVAAAPVHDGRDIVDRVAGLSTAWREEKMLETTSGITNPEGVVKVEISDDDAADALAAAPAASKAKGKGKARATTAAAGSARGKKAAPPQPFTAATTPGTATTTTGFTSINRDADSNTNTNTTTTRPATKKAGPSTRAKKSKS